MEKIQVKEQYEDVKIVWWNPLTLIKWASSGSQFRSWWFHPVGSAAMGLLAAIPLAIFTALSLHVAFAIGCTLSGLYYWKWREPMDALMHLEAGHEDVGYELDRLAGYEIHWRVDGVGDAVGPVTLAWGVWLTVILMLF